MCFFTLNRYRFCCHDQVGSFAAFCTTAKARSSLNGSNSTQITPQEKHDDTHDSFSDFLVGIDDHHPEPTYCGQPLFSPKYMNDSGSDDLNGGVCQNCVEMERIVNEGNFKRDFPYPDVMSEDGIDDLASWPGGNAYDKVIQLKANQQLEQRHNWQAPSKASGGVFFQRHPVSPNFGNHHINIPLPPQESFHHPLFKSQKYAQRKPVSLNQQPPPPQVQSQSYPAAPEIAGNRGSENPADMSAVLQQMLHNYPQRTRSAVEKAVANRTSKQREQTFMNLRSGLEEKIKMQDTEK